MTKSPRAELRPLLESRLLGTALRVLAILHVALFMPDWIWKNRPNDRRDRDVKIYYETAGKVLRHASLYVPMPHYGPDQTPFEYLYLPPFAAFIAPLGHLTYLQFAWLWFLFQLGSFWLFAWILARLAGARAGAMPVLVAGLVLAACPGSYRAVGLGQVDATMWVLAGGAVLLLINGGGRNDLVGGALLGIAAVVKPYALFPLLATRGRRAWGAGFGIIIAALVFGALACGTGAYGDWLSWVAPRVTQGTFNADNYSLSMAVLRLALVAGWRYTGGPIHGLPALWLKSATLLGPLGAVWVTRKLSPAWRCALVTVAAAWCAPICWSDYVPLVLIVGALGWREYVKGEVAEPVLDDALARNFNQPV